MRSLSSEETAELEQMKFDILCRIDPSEEITSNVIYDCIKNRKGNINSGDIYKRSLFTFSKSNQRQPSIDELRTIQISSYAILKS